VPYVVFEVLQGETLGARLQRAPLATPEALGYALQLARGLAVAHDRGLVHAGLGPENVFLGRDGRARVLDFAPVDRAVDSTAGPGLRRDVEAWGRLAGEMLAGGSPRAVRAVLERSLERDPARAYASARDLAVALEQAAAQEDVEGPAPARWALWPLWVWVGLAAVTGTVAALLLR
jgi:serine/threonine-protein kinase